MKKSKRKDKNGTTIKISYIYLAVALIIILAGGSFVYSRVGSQSEPEGKLIFDIAVGKPAPAFSLENINGETVDLSDYLGKNVVLFFSGGAMCYPACWDQIAALGNDRRFNTGDIVAFSIVGDPKSKWQRIVKKTANFSKAKILFDQSKTVSLAYNVLSLPSSMHPGTSPGHTYFIVNREGMIVYTLDDPKMAVRNNILISQLSKLSGGN